MTEKEKYPKTILGKLFFPISDIRVKKKSSIIMLWALFLLVSIDSLRKGNLVISDNFVPIIGVLFWLVVIWTPGLINKLVDIFERKTNGTGSGPKQLITFYIKVAFVMLALFVGASTLVLLVVSIYNLFSR